jgi:DNA-binding MarR family transcriptional regulator
MTHPTRGLDDVVHQRVRLGILAVLQEVQRVDFTTLADVLGLTAGNLSRNLSVLEENGYIRVEKTFEGRRPRTWLEATPAGRAALDQEVRALRELLGRLERGRPRTAPASGLRRATAGPAPS